MGRVIFLFVALFGIGILGLGASAAAAGASPGGDRTYPRGKPITPGAIPPDPPAGSRAIPVATPTDATISAASPRLTVDAVKAYFATNRHPDNVGEAATIEAIEFVPAVALTDHFNGAKSFAPARLLCVVTLRGTFHVNGPPHLPGWDGPVGYQVFDAQTGNSLLEVVSPR